MYGIPRSINYCAASLQWNSIFYSFSSNSQTRVHNMIHCSSLIANYRFDIRFFAETIRNETKLNKWFSIIQLFIREHYSSSIIQIWTFIYWLNNKFVRNFAWFQQFKFAIFQFWFFSHNWLILMNKLSWFMMKKPAQIKQWTQVHNFNGKQMQNNREFSCLGKVTFKILTFFLSQSYLQNLLFYM